MDPPPDRPLPAGRITAQNAADVRWLLVPVCLVFSAMYGRQALAFSTCFEALSIWYNEFGGHKAGSLPLTEIHILMTRVQPVPR